MSAIAQPVPRGEGAVKQKFNWFHYMVKVAACASGAGWGMSVALLLIEIIITGPLCLGVAKRCRLRRTTRTAELRRFKPDLPRLAIVILGSVLQWIVGIKPTRH